MRVYLDNCCFNRPFDDQRQLRIRLEAEAKLRIQEVIREGGLQLAWSYVLDFENSNNPFVDRREGTRTWRTYATVDSIESPAIKAAAESFAQIGLRKIDALHVACAVVAGCGYFITTDDQVLGKADRISEVKIVDPIEFIKKGSSVSRCGTAWNAWVNQATGPSTKKEKRRSIARTPRRLRRGAAQWSAPPHVSEPWGQSERTTKTDCTGMATGGQRTTDDGYQLFFRVVCVFRGQSFVP